MRMSGKWPNRPLRARGLAAFAFALPLVLFVLILSSAAWSSPATSNPGPAGPAASGGLRLVSRVAAGAWSAPDSIKPRTATTNGVIVDFAPGTSKATMRQAAQGGEVVVDEVQAGKGGSRPRAVYTSKTLDAEELTEKVRKAPGVVRVSPNNVNTVCSTPNDTLFADLWGLDNPGTWGSVVDADIDAPEAWDLTTGSQDVVVAVVDSGVAYTHRDLASNMWVNLGEVAGDGIDNDNNGYIDDVHGIDAFSGDSDPWDENGHGTHVAGTVAAVGNNGLDVTGVAWQSKIMALRFLGADGSGEDADAIECIYYAIDMKVNHGVNVVAINASWGSYGGYDAALVDAIRAAGDAGIVFCAAAGNDSTNTDAVPFYPAAYACSCILSVGASDAWDTRAFFDNAGGSNYGATSVDVFAPGKSVLSTVPGYPFYYPQEGDPFFDDMESGPDQWIAEGTWAITTEAHISGTHSWSDSPSGKYRNSTDSSLSTHSLDLTALAGHDTVLGFFAAFILEDGYDWLVVEASGDGGSTWSALGYLTGTETGGYYNAPLPEGLLASDSRVRFRLVSDESYTYDGVYIDDVGIASFVPEECVFLSGTSMAAPYVSGTVALLASMAPSESAATRIDRILMSADPKEPLSGLCITGGRLNAEAAITTTLPAPTVTSLIPVSGPTKGGNSVVINGTGFVGLAETSAVTFGGVPATSYRVNSLSRITAVVPPNASTGTVDVVVHATRGDSDSTGAGDDYTYLSRYEQTDSHIVYSGTWYTFPTPPATSPASGGSYARASAGGSSVTIYFDGSRLDWIAMKGTTTGKADVYLDDVLVSTVDLSSSIAVYEQDVWSTGVLDPGLHKVRISRNAQSAAGKYVTLDAVDVFGTLVSAPPTITGLSPTSGSTHGGTPVVISGTYLDGATAVTFGGIDAAGFTVDSSTRVSAVSPAHSAGPVRVQVTTPGGTTADTVSDNFTYVEVASPTISGLSPASGSTTGGTAVTITGTGFVGLSGAAAVKFGDVNATSYKVDSPTRITATSPAHPAGQVRVQVTALGGVTADTTADDFMYAAPAAKHEQTSTSLVYSGTWATFSTASASGGSYKRSSTAGAAVVIPFNGTRLDWIATRGTTMGKADIYLDGVLMVGALDLYRSSVSYKNVVWTTGSLPSGYHTVKVVRSSESAAGKYINIDAVEVAGTLVANTRVEQTSARLVWSPGPSTWTLGTGSTAYYSGGSYRYINKTGSVTINFTGVSLGIIAKKASSYGIARVSLDGEPPVSVNLYRSTTAYKQTVWSSGWLAPGDHTVTFSWTGTKSGSTGTTVDLDAVDVRGALR